MIIQIIITDSIVDHLAFIVESKLVTSRLGAGRNFITQVSNGINILSWPSLEERQI